MLHLHLIGLLTFELLTLIGALFLLIYINKQQLGKWYRFTGKAIVIALPVIIIATVIHGIAHHFTDGHDHNKMDYHKKMLHKKQQYKEHFNLKTPHEDYEHDYESNVTGFSRYKAMDGKHSEHEKHEYFKNLHGITDTTDSTAKAMSNCDASCTRLCCMYPDKETGECRCAEFGKDCVALCCASHDKRKGHKGKAH
jgi:hypothetical protein